MAHDITELPTRHGSVIAPRLGNEVYILDRAGRWMNPRAADPWDEPVPPADIAAIADRVAAGDWITFHIAAETENRP